MKRRNRFIAMLFLSTALVLGGCGLNTAGSSATEVVSMDSTVPDTGNEIEAADETSKSTSNKTEDNMSSASVSVTSDTLLDTTDMFSDRDTEQEADTSEATEITLESGKDVTITEEGVYVIKGSVSDSTIIVEAEDTAKVQLVLEGVSITNSDSPAIYVKSADKVFVTTSSDSSLTVSGTFTADADTNTDAVIYSKDDLVFNGTGSLTISSTANGISGKDDVKFTGGTYNITSEGDGIEANDSVRISDGSFTIKSAKDAIHAEDSEDTSVGFVYISGGDMKIEAADDGIQATTVLQIDGGSMDITAAEGLEATYVQINDGTINISASDDGVNATSKSTSYEVVIEINGGNLTIVMGSGDTDALDANGSLYINGGTVDITAQFAFDFDKTAELNGGTVTVNGEQVTEITNSMMMGGGMGGQGGFGGGRMGGFQNGDGTAPAAGDGSTPPQLPEGVEEGSMPQMPEGFDGTNPPQMQNGQGGFGRKGGRGKNAQNDASSSSATSGN